MVAALAATSSHGNARGAGGTFRGGPGFGNDAATVSASSGDAVAGPPALVTPAASAACVRTSGFAPDVASAASSDCTSTANATPAQHGVILAAMLLFAGYFIALHTLIVTRTWPLVLVALVVAPWLATLGAAVLRSLRAPPTGRRTAALVALVATFAALTVLAVAGIASARLGAAVASRTDVLLFLENSAFFTWLSVLFAASLFGNGEALVTRMARKTRRGDMPPSVIRYTRFVTLGWSIFFAMLLATTGILFFGASRESWSFFVNLLLWPLLGAGFVVEYLIRINLLRDVTHGPMLASMRAFDHRGAGGGGVGVAFVADVDEGVR